VCLNNRKTLMAIIQTINSYSLGIPINTSNVRGVVRLSCANGWTATIQFQDTTALPNNVLNVASKSILAFSTADSYLRRVDLVRNEEPASVVINDLVNPATLNIFMARSLWVRRKSEALYPPKQEQ
jgi:hypothetical protein